MSEQLTRSSKHIQKALKSKKLINVLPPLRDFNDFSTCGWCCGTCQAESSQQAFINEIGNSAAAVANSNDMYASVMIAQALLESSYGSSGLASAPNYNLFGVKGSYNGQSVYMPTKEYLDGQWVTVTARFRSYNFMRNRSKIMPMLFVPLLLGIHTIIQAFGRVILAVIAMQQPL